MNEATDEIETDQLISYLDCNNNGFVDARDINHENWLIFADVEFLLRQHGLSLITLNRTQMPSEDAKISVDSLKSLVRTEAAKSYDQWDPKHKALIQPPTKEELQKELKKTYIVAPEANKGYTLVGEINEKGKLLTENHPVGILFSLYKASGGELDQRINIQILDNAISDDKHLTLREFFETYKSYLEIEDGHFPTTESPGAWRDPDALAFIQLGLTAIPVDQWDTKWETVRRIYDETTGISKETEGPKVSFNDVVKAAAEYYLKQERPYNGNGHGGLHMVEVLVKYYSKLNDREGLEKLKQKFLKDELSILFPLSDIGEIGHYAESLGFLLSADINWTEEEKAVIHRWVNNLKLYVLENKSSLSDSEASHLYKGLDLIDKYATRVNWKR